MMFLKVPFRSGKIFQLVIKFKTLSKHKNKIIIKKKKKLRKILCIGNPQHERVKIKKIKKIKNKKTKK